MPLFQRKEQSFPKPASYEVQRKHLLKNERVKKLTRLKTCFNFTIEPVEGEIFDIKINNSRGIGLKKQNWSSYKYKWKPLKGEITNL